MFFITHRESFRQFQIVRVGFRPGSISNDTCQTVEFCFPVFLFIPHTYLGKFTWTLYRFSTCFFPFRSRDTERFCIQNWYSLSRAGRASLKTKIGRKGGVPNSCKVGGQRTELRVLLWGQ